MANLLFATRESDSLRSEIPGRSQPSRGLVSATSATDNSLGGTFLHWQTAPPGRTELFWLLPTLGPSTAPTPAKTSGALQAVCKAIAAPDDRPVTYTWLGSMSRIRLFSAAARSTMSRMLWWRSAASLKSQQP